MRYDGAAPQSSPPPEMAQATPFDAILAQSRDLFRDRLCEAVSGMLEHAGPSLDTLAEKAAEEELQKR